METVSLPEDSVNFCRIPRRPSQEDITIEIFFLWLVTEIDYKASDQRLGSQSEGKPFPQTITTLNTIACRAVTMQRPRDKYARAVSRQLLGKQVPAATDTNVAIVHQ
jgi:hypothetical protein